VVDDDPQRVFYRLPAWLLLLHFIDDVPFSLCERPGQTALDELACDVLKGAICG
jgi:hypothetical protein